MPEWKASWIALWAWALLTAIANSYFWLGRDAAAKRRWYLFTMTVTMLVGYCLLWWHFMWNNGERTIAWQIGLLTAVFLLAYWRMVRVQFCPSCAWMAMPATFQPRVTLCRRCDANLAGEIGERKPVKL